MNAQILFVNISARIGELGRQPYWAQNFIIQYADQILFVLDCSPDLEAYRITYRILETDDEYFNDNIGYIPKHGRWFVYGLNLPDRVLRKVYNLNE
jgi:hypothetical protein